MGRLFWKFFLAIWFAQMAAIFSVSVIFWLHRESRTLPEPPPPFEHPGRPAPDALRPPPPGARAHHPGRGAPPPWRIPWAPLGTAAMASLLVSALLASYVTRPVGWLRAAFANAAQGQLSARVAHRLGRRNDELADLAKDFDRMAEHLEALITSQKRLLHDVSHELRSPLARMQAALDLMSQQPHRLAEWRGRLERESQSMDQLIGELLTLSRLNAGHPLEDSREFEIDEVIQAIVEDAQFEAEKAHRKVQFSGSTRALIRGNAHWLHRAIENVVRNALKHTPEETPIEIRVRETANGGIEIKIQDHGPGVPENELEKIFEPFYKSSSAPHGGHGLGLALARSVVLAHGGQIEAHNTLQGGLLVTIRLQSINHS